MSLSNGLAMVVTLVICLGSAQAQTEEIEAQTKALKEAEEALAAGDIATAKALLNRVGVALGVYEQPIRSIQLEGVDPETNEEFLARLFAETGAALNTGDTTTARSRIEQIKLVQGIVPKMFTYSRALEVLILEAKVLTAEGRRQEALRVLETRKEAESIFAWANSLSTLGALVELDELAKADHHEEVIAKGRALATVREMTPSELGALYSIIGRSLLQQVLENPDHPYHRHAQNLAKLEEPARQDGLLCLANRLLAQSVGIRRLPECWGR